MERVKQGLDPIGVIRDARDDKPIRITSDDIGDLTWDEGMRLFDLTPEERIHMIASQAQGGPARARR